MTERGGLELTEIPRDVTPPLPALLLGGKYSRLLHVRQRGDVIVEPEPIRKGLTKSETKSFGSEVAAFRDTRSGRRPTIPPGGAEAAIQGC